MSVYQAILGVAADMAKDGISKSRKNDQQGYKFRGIDEVLNALSPSLVKNQLVILPRIMARSVAERVTQKGGTLFYVTVEAEFDFISAVDGSVHTVRTFGEAMDSGDKATNKAMSAAYKYAAFQAFCIPTEGDNDADATTHDIAAPVPKGYEAWAESAEAVAVEGLDALKKFWKESPEDFRKYATGAANGWWEALKKRAAQPLVEEIDRDIAKASVPR